MKQQAGKCGKPKGEYCRLHNPQPESTLSDREQFIREGLREYNKRELGKKKHPCKPEAEIFAELALQRQQERLAEEKRAQDFLVDDMDRFMYLTVHPKTGEKTVSIYRAGVVEVPTQRGVEEESYLACDKYTPEGRQGRNTGIFASPTMNGVTHWVRGVSNVVKDWGVRELRVNPDEVYVYSVREWEKFSGNWDGFTQEAASAYWNSGMTLTQWYQEMRTNPTMKPEEWELLISPENVKQTKNVKADIVSRQAYYSDKGERSTYMYNLLTKQLGRRS